MSKKPPFTFKTLFKIDLDEGTEGNIVVKWETDEDHVGFAPGDTPEDHGEPPYTYLTPVSDELAESLIRFFDEKATNWQDEIHGYKELKELLKKRRVS